MIARARLRGAVRRGPGAGGVRAFWPRPRVRRLVDVARLALAAAALAGLLVLAFRRPDLLADTARLIPAALTGLPRVVLSIANVVASLVVVGVLLAIAADSLRGRRFAITSAASAAVLGCLAWGAVQLVAGALPSAELALLQAPRHGSAGLPVTAAVALIVGADLQYRRRFGAARLAVAAAVICALGLGSLTVPSAIFAVLLGTTTGLAVRVVLGVLPARPPDELVRSVLARVGWPVTALRPLDQTAGRVRFAGTRPDGGDLQVTVVDPDRRGVLVARRGWRLLRLRTAAVGQPALSLRGYLEQQALSAALAQGAGVATPRVLALVAAGPALVLVERPLAGAPLPPAPETTPEAADGAPEAAPEGAVDGAAEAAARGAVAAWDALRRLHDAGLAHGALTADAVVLLPDGRAGFADLRAAQPAASELQRELDVVALLAATVSRTGAAGAVAALRSGYRSTPALEARLAALLQPLALPPPVRRQIRGTPLLGELRAALTGFGAEPAVTVPRLERLSTRTVLSLVGGTLAVHILATQLSDVGIGSALREARPSWLAVALVGSAVTYLGAALTLQAFAPIRLPLPRTTLVQLASSFVTLVTPPTVGQVGLNIRYLQRSGVDTPTAAASVAVKEAVTVPVTVLLLLVCGWLSGVSASRLALLPSGEVLVVLLAAAAVLAVVAALPPTRRMIRRRVEPLVRRTLPQLLATVSQPRRLALAVAGILVLNGGYILALDASLRAFSTSLALPALVVVYFAASAVGSAAPTPGGLGAVEAALIGGLTATGVPVTEALTAVLAFRAVTFWLPAPLGWVAFVSLQRTGRI